MPALKLRAKRHKITQIDLNGLRAVVYDLNIGRAVGVDNGFSIGCSIFLQADARSNSAVRAGKKRLFFMSEKF
jgi:hypothetical protein